MPLVGGRGGEGGGGGLAAERRGRGGGVVGLRCRHGGAGGGDVEVEVCGKGALLGEVRGAGLFGEGWDWRWGRACRGVVGAGAAIGAGGEKVGLGKGLDAVFIFETEGLFAGGVDGGFVGDKGRVAVVGDGAVAVVGDGLEGVVDFVVEDGADRSGGRLGRDEVAGFGLSFGSGDVELALRGTGWCVFAADAQLFFEPFHDFGSFKGPDHLHGLGHGFVFTHPLDQVQKL